ncbi:MAG: type II toxin-antitoxin system HicB family antitoxin [Anaerolineae bacterium]|nr:type II toxin-antitoxin system HicB family antitoxin [Anaerolineae bacterium]
MSFDTIGSPSRTRAWSNKEQIFKLPLVLEPQPEGGYTITCPLIPGLITEADTLDQVQPHVADALAALIEGHQALGKPMPPALHA